MVGESQRGGETERKGNGEWLLHSSENVFQVCIARSVGGAWTRRDCWFVAVCDGLYVITIRAACMSRPNTVKIRTMYHSQRESTHCDVV